MTSVVTEAFVTGLVASAVGILARIGIAIGLQALLRGIGIELPSTATKVAAEDRDRVAGSGDPRHRHRVGGARAARLEGGADRGAQRDERPPTSSLRRRSITGGALTSLAVVLLGLGLFGSTRNRGIVVGAGAALTFVGIAVLSPLFARPLAAVIGRPLRGALPGRLGGRTRCATRGGRPRRRRR